MNNYKISLNQLAMFLNASDSKKKTIIKQQKNPNKFLVAWYQLSKSRIRKSLSDYGNLEPINQGIIELVNRKPEKPRQIIDKQVSIEALRRFLVIKLPELLIDVPHEIIKKVDSKSIIINDVEIIVSPDVIYKLQINGKTYLGAVKIHISKNNIFNTKQSRYISTTLYKYLEGVIKKEDEIVLRELCLSIDVFGEKVIKAPKTLKNSIIDIETICEEIKSFWNAA